MALGHVDLAPDRVWSSPTMDQREQSIMCTNQVQTSGRDRKIEQAMSKIPALD